MAPPVREPDGYASCEADQRAAAAFRAISLRCSGVSFSARALPPFLPPSRPSSTAAGFLLSFGSGSGSSLMDWATMAAAIEFRSRGLLERFGTTTHGTLPARVRLPLL